MAETTRSDKGPLAMAAGGRGWSVLYSPYGAFEMKAKYQRNFLFGTLITTSVVALIVIVAAIISSLPEEDYSDVPQVVIKTVADLGPPPSIARKPPQVQVAQPQVAAPKVGIPKPVADEEVVDEDVVIATQEELAEITAPSISEAAGSGDIVVDIQEEDFIPAPEDFVPVEVQPEVISEVKPDYPPLARQAGITGDVYVKALVDEQGNVMKAILAKSSGTQSLDDAALEAAHKRKYRPGIQNNRPIKVWVTYKVEFRLNE
ncbi:MAG TPA: TonB family protein [candidate division Zixibacteria bacterium]|nr:energy transducer TonB [candidate division Zixibacteria bacterium]MDD4918119.1 TonB family protein [candidate division Zixibacteria bacterium]MDM7972062.1 TonB family protein [candidate division Zixibacteria bacterium]HOD67618.1 TonB family protein [candidate division Zixibacteria bacterium]HPC11111.1 TonB family protein [candidate division Zixibacteria bacterium]